MLANTIAAKFVSFFFYQQTALHIAASKGRGFTVKCLVKQGANIIIKDKNEVKCDYSTHRLLASQFKSAIE